jgi:hypothetical protein
MLAIIQERSFVIVLGKWWHVSLVLIALVVVAVWLTMKFSGRKQPRN